MVSESKRRKLTIREYSYDIIKTFYYCIFCRIKDGEVVLTDVTQDQSTLYLDDMKRNHSGQYRCRASNDHSSAYSETAEVGVEGKGNKKTPVARGLE